MTKNSTPIYNAQLTPSQSRTPETVGSTPGLNATGHTSEAAAADEGLLHDIEDLLLDADRRQDTTVPPLQRFGKKSISVTDFTSQLWCEEQLQHKLTTRLRRETEAMRKGTERHLQLELEDHDILEVYVDTEEERQALQLVNAINLLRILIATGKTREMYVIGVVDGVPLRGIIDELKCVSNEKTQKQEVSTGVSE
eukprot:GHVU01126300.1.p3 GENE.GHVU01126300.1~~GHVU01126300.1.p3  ORF type:complete len:196 (-),score=39.18 GHVU01126300.1:536-1123(-)